MNSSRDKITRTFSQKDGKRLAIRLEPETWAAIDLLASRYGQRWQQWASAVLAAHPTPLNVTGFLRTAAMEALIGRLSEASGQFDPPTAMSHPLLRLVTPVDRQCLEQELRDSDDLYAVDMGGFVLHAVNRHQGGPALIIENKVIGQLSVVICEDE
jgi:hypothetical protein